MIPTEFVPTPEYRTLEAWMADSDYTPSDACGGWLDADGNEVDPLACWRQAMAASDTAFLVVEVDCESGEYRLLDTDGNLAVEPTTGHTLADGKAWTFGLTVADLLQVDTAIYSPRTEKPTRAEYLAKKEAHRG